MRKLCNGFIYIPEESTELLGYDLTAVKPPVLLASQIPANDWILIIYVCIIEPLITLIVLSITLLFLNKWEVLPLEKLTVPRFGNINDKQYFTLTHKPQPYYL